MTAMWTILEVLGTAALILFVLLLIGLVLFAIVAFVTIAGKELKKIKEEEVQKDGGTE